MNRRYVLKNRKRFYVFVIAMTAVLSCMFLAATVNGADTNSTFTNITVEKGDTLWDLAKEYSDGGDIRDYIHKIQKLNHMPDGDIFAGEVIKMPV